MDDGVTGFLCRDHDAMVDAVGTVGEIDRQKCRTAVEERFSTSRMVARHLELFESLLASPAGSRLPVAGEVP